MKLYTFLYRSLFVGFFLASVLFAYWAGINLVWDESSTWGLLAQMTPESSDFGFLSVFSIAMAFASYLIIKERMHDYDAVRIVYRDKS